MVTAKLVVEEVKIFILTIILKQNRLCLEKSESDIVAYYSGII